MTPLERMLRDAWFEPGLRPAFYARLLDTKVFVPVQPLEGQSVSAPIGAGERVNVITLVRTDGAGVIPLFTSAERLFVDLHRILSRDFHRKLSHPFGAV